MLKDLATSIPLHLPYLAAIVIGGLSGRFLSDRHLIKSAMPVFLVTLFLLVVSIVAQSMLIDEATGAAMLLFNAISGACIAFILTAFGEFDKAPG